MTAQICVKILVVSGVVNSYTNIQAAVLMVVNPVLLSF